MVVKTIQKRDGTVQGFDLSKIENAIKGAMNEVGHDSDSDAKSVALLVYSRLDEKIAKDASYEWTVEAVQDLVEDSLMSSDFHDVAKAYIIYRDKKSKERKRDIFKKRRAIRPYEYPEFIDYVEGIRHSYWIHTEFSYTSDIQDFKFSVNDVEKDILKKGLLIVAQIENQVETFWTDIYKKMPKPEVSLVGTTFAESECRHQMAYAHLIEVLGLQDEFDLLTHEPVLVDRIDFLDNILNGGSFENNREYIETIFLFSLFIENASLFTLFFIVMSFNKHRNLFKGVSNVVEATSKEEQIHALFARNIIEIVKDEHPDWFDEAHIEHVKEVTQVYFDKEMKVVEYIFEQGELDFLNKEMTIEFLKNRFNTSLQYVGIDPIFDIDQKILEKTYRFDDEMSTTKHVDFFNKRAINYNKKSKSITEDDLF